MTVGLRTGEAARRLGVAANTLRSWTQRYGYPKEHKSDGGHRYFATEDIEFLRRRIFEGGLSPVEAVRELAAAPMAKLQVACPHCGQTLDHVRIQPVRATPEAPGAQLPSISATARRE